MFGLQLAFVCLRLSIWLHGCGHRIALCLGFCRFDSNTGLCLHEAVDLIRRLCSVCMTFVSDSVGLPPKLCLHETVGLIPWLWSFYMRVWVPLQARLLFGILWVSLLSWIVFVWGCGFYYKVGLRFGFCRFDSQTGFCLCEAIVWSHEGVTLATRLVWDTVCFTPRLWILLRGCLMFWIL
jgi:hypothetical protein